MSELTTYRYPGARPFQRTEMDRLLFRGRSEETQTLFHLINAESMVVLFAKSGMGKSSLLNAGLYHVLVEKEYFPVFIRCNTPDRSLIETVIDECAAEARRRGVDLESGSRKALWSCFKTTEFWSAENKLLTPVLIFDQFEELFEFYPKPERAEFLVQLADLLKPVTAHTNTYDDVDVSEAAPDIRVLLALREDNLAHLDELSPWLPSIFRDRFRLTELDLDAAREAIVEPAHLKHEAFSTPTFAYEEGAIDTILNFLRQQRFGERRIETDYVEPFQLQLICQYVETNIVKAIGGADYRVKEGDLGGEEGLKKILHDFYHRQLRDTFTNPGVQRAVRRLCEKALIIEGTNKRISRAEEELVGRYNVDRALLNRMVEARLIRSETRLGGRYYELSHDTLVEPILETKRQRERTITRRTLTGVAVLALAGLIWMVSINQRATDCENIAGAQRQWCEDCTEYGGKWDPSIQDDSRYCVGAQFELLDVEADFVDIPPGEFVMGTPNPEEGDEDERPARTVILEDSFKVGRTEVTQAQWYAVMGNNPSAFKGMNHPVESVSWDDIQTFLSQLNAKQESYAFRLPTEAEWEYSCRSGEDWEYAMDTEAGRLEDYAWYIENSNDSTRLVALKQPNGFGLNDMSGNVYEWVSDYYGPYNAFTEVDPRGPENGELRVFRGGSFVHDLNNVRCAFRNGFNPLNHSSYLGFRVVALPRSALQPPQEGR